MRARRVCKAVRGVGHTVLEGVDLEPAGAEEVLVAWVRPTRCRAGRWGRCGRRAPGYDQGQGRRRWRGLDLGTRRVSLQADAPAGGLPREWCRGRRSALGPASLPLQHCRRGHRRGAGGHAALSVVSLLGRITGRAVSAIVIRILTEATGKRDRLAGLGRIGIDEISYRRGQRSLLCVVDHDTGRLVWVWVPKTLSMCCDLHLRQPCRGSQDEAREDHPPCSWDCPTSP